MTGTTTSRGMSGTAAKEAATGLLDKLSQSQGIAYLAELTGFRPQQILLAMGAGCVLIFFGFGADILTNIIGFIYPMYKSFQTVEATGFGVSKPDKELTVDELKQRLDSCVRILMYWVVYTFFTLGEFFSDYILFWIPFYYFLKLGVLLWFIKGDGAKTVYMQFSGLLLKKYEHHIDKAVEEMGSHATQFRKDVQTGVGGLVSTHSQRLTGAVLEGLSSISKAGESESTAASPDEADEKLPPTDRKSVV